MSVDEFEHIENDPVAVFEIFCNDYFGGAPNERQMALFRKAVENYGRGDE